MSRRNGKRSISRLSFAELGIDKSMYLQLRAGCVAGKHGYETLSAACRGLEIAEPWIIMSVTQNKSYDAMRVKWELGEIKRAPIGRSDFYGFRRRFYYNLDRLLKNT